MSASVDGGVSPELLDLAYRRADGILRSYRIRNTWFRHQRAREIVAEAMELGGRGDLEQRVGELTQERIETWFKELARASGIPEKNGYLDRIRLATWCEHFCEVWPGIFLKELPPAEALQTFAQFDLQVTPPIDRTTLGASSLEFGAAESVAEGARTVVARYPVLRKIFFYGAMLLLGITVYILAR